MGKQQQYRLGKWFRQRYNGTLLSKNYDSSELAIDVCSDNRCKESALSNLIGMFDTENTEWNSELIWPIKDALHEVKYDDTTYVEQSKLCPNFNKYLEEYCKTEEYIRFEKSLKPKYDYLTKHSGENVTDIVTINRVIDTLNIEQMYNMT